ncbi:hypothetical protein N2152v2_008595 [Parachlorella kessleri]
MASYHLTLVAPGCGLSLLQGNNLSGPLPVPTLEENSADLEVLPGNEGLCWPKAATLEVVLNKHYVCSGVSRGDLTGLSACRQDFKTCVSRGRGGLALGLWLTIVALLAVFNTTLLALAFKRRCGGLRRRAFPSSALDVQLAASQGSIGAGANELGLSDAAGELEALLQKYQSPSDSQGGLVEAENQPLRSPGLSRRNGLQAQLLAQDNEASPPSSAAPAVPVAPRAWSSRFGRVQIQDVQFCRAADGSLVLLGQGASGSVFKAELAGCGAVAVKVLRKQSVDVARLLREAEIMHLCRHPSLPELVGVCEVGGLLMLVSEFVERGSLQNLLCLPELRWHARGRGLLLDVAQAVQHLHYRNVLHADIKPQNVLVTHHWHAKLADVGTARYLRSGIASSACGGTILYAAPEQLLGLPCTAAADIFSLGLLMLAVVVGQAGQVRGLCLSPRVPEDCPAEVAQLIAACLQDDPAERPSAVQVVEVLLSS